MVFVVAGLMRVIFFGTPTFAASILRALLEAGVQVVAVVTQPPRPKGRSSAPQPTETALVAREFNLPLFEPPKASDPDFIDALRALQPDLLVVVAYGKILRPALLDLCPLGAINLHASLLPSYRGAAPMQRALMAGERVTGVTIQYMAIELDAGDVIAGESIPIPEEMRLEDLELALNDVGRHLLLKVLRQIERGDAIRVAQNHQMATYAPKVEREECKIEWSRPADELHNLIRAVYPRPLAWCRIELRGREVELKIRRSRPLMCKSGATGSILTYEGDRFEVACKKGALQLLELQLEGKRAVTAAEWIRGYERDSIRFLTGLGD